jgi:hypothetical protein
MVAYMLLNVCFIMRWKGKIIFLFLSGIPFYKHVRHKKVDKNIGINVKKGDYYYSKVCKHTKNKKFHVSHSCKSVITQVVNGLARD